MNPRIALFITSLEGGGAEGAYVLLANEFASKGMQVDLVLGQLRGPYVEQVDGGVRIIELGSNKWAVLTFRLMRYLKAEQPDVLLSGLDVPNVAAVLATRLAGMPMRCVVSQRAVIRTVWELGYPRTWRFWVRVLGLAYSRARLVICNSHAAAAEVVNELGVNPLRCEVIHNPLDLNRIAEMANRPLDDPWVSASAPPLLLAVGSLTPRKDMGTLLHAMTIVKRSIKCNLVILGEGPERPVLEALRSELRLEDCVRMPGYDGNPFRWMAAADIVINASLAEGCPNVLQQALACGTAVIATDCPGGTSEILEDGRWGCLVPIRNPEAIAQAIHRTLEEEAPPNGPMRARDFEKGRVVDRYLELLLPREAASQGRSPGSHEA
jgi:glycosyltransferase involved in cell wall biosynthesis